jgi:hypothetical protein
MFVVFGACLAGLYLILRDLLPFLEAHRSGVVRTRGYKREAVRRSEDPARFKALLRNHIDGMVIGLLAVLFGILWTFFGLFALIAIFPIGALMTSMSRRSKTASRRVAEAFD